jgi:hypothetical protein
VSNIRSRTDRLRVLIAAAIGAILLARRDRGRRLVRWSRRVQGAAGAGCDPKSRWCFMNRARRSAR